MTHNQSITCILCNEEGTSIFTEKLFALVDKNGMLLTSQIGAKNFRVRVSHPHYKTTWHLSGDPTLIAVLSGTLRISLRSGEYKDFINGDLFIAADNLPNNIEFEASKHGHLAEVIGDSPLQAIHIKLDQFEF